MPKSDLYSHFKPNTYLLEKNDQNLHLVISGQKTGPPIRRISLHQAGLKVSGAKVTRFDKHGSSEIDVTRINHLPTIQQVRLHSPSVMYPGRYQIELEYKFTSDTDINLDDIRPVRKAMPSIDEPEAWQAAKLEFKR